MICPACSDNGQKVDMDHFDGEELYHDPGAYHGIGVRVGCGIVCPRCGFTDECTRSHKLRVQQLKALVSNNTTR